MRAARLKYYGSLTHTSVTGCDILTNVPKNSVDRYVQVLWEIYICCLHQRGVEVLKIVSRPSTARCSFKACNDNHVHHDIFVSATACPTACVAPYLAFNHLGSLVPNRKWLGRKISHQLNTPRCAPNNIGHTTSHPQIWTIDWSSFSDWNPKLSRVFCGSPYTLTKCTKPYTSRVWVDIRLMSRYCRSSIAASIELARCSEFVMMPPGRPQQAPLDICTPPFYSPSNHNFWTHP